MKLGIILLVVATLSSLQQESSAAVTKNPRCMLPIPLITCRMLLEGWYFDTTGGKCVEYNSGGCEQEGESNHFLTEQECKEICLPRESTSRKPPTTDSLWWVWDR